MALYRNGPLNWAAHFYMLGREGISHSANRIEENTCPIFILVDCLLNKMDSRVLYSTLGRNCVYRFLANWYIMRHP